MTRSWHNESVFPVECNCREADARECYLHQLLTINLGGHYHGRCSCLCHSPEDEEWDAIVGRADSTLNQTPQL